MMEVIQLNRKKDAGNKQLQIIQAQDVSMRPSA
jgi:hypothetical protein